MAEKKETRKLENVRKMVTDNPLTRSAHKTVLVGAGTAAILREETTGVLDKGGEWLDKLVERGERVEKDITKRARKVAEKPRTELDKTGDRVSQALDKVLERLNIPTRRDVKELNAKVTALTKKVDELKKARAA